MSSRRSFRAARRAFTIAEIIVVVIIIGVLAALIVPRLVNKVGMSKRTVAQAGCNSIAGVLGTMISETSWTPQSGVDLAGVLMSRPPEVPADRGSFPYFNNADQLKDPWGNPYHLIVPGVRNADFDIVSYGSDGQPGGAGEAEDITNK